jgi:hypothetical protein
VLLPPRVGRRGEACGADQDNGLIHAGKDGDDAWFADFGSRVADFLDEAGVPRCKGGVMASNAAWRGTNDAWRERIATWLRRARPEDLLNIDIFFDLIPVAGDFALGRSLHRDAVGIAAQHPTFLALLAASVEAYAPRFGLFGNLRVEDGRIDLKRDGLRPRLIRPRAGASIGSMRGRPRPSGTSLAPGGWRARRRDADRDPWPIDGPHPAATASGLEGGHRAVKPCRARHAVARPTKRAAQPAAYLLDAVVREIWSLIVR